MHYIEGAVVGLAVGVFAPGVARQAKALWVKWTQKVETAVKNKV